MGRRCPRLVEFWLSRHKHSCFPISRNGFVFYDHGCSEMVSPNEVARNLTYLFEVVRRFTRVFWFLGDAPMRGNRLQSLFWVSFKVDSVDFGLGSLIKTQSE